MGGITEPISSSTEGEGSVSWPGKVAQMVTSRPASGGDTDTENRLMDKRVGEDAEGEMNAEWRGSLYTTTCKTDRQCEPAI